MLGPNSPKIRKLSKKAEIDKAFHYLFHKENSMKANIILFLLFLTLSISLLADPEKKKLYVSKITATKEVSESIQKSVVNKIKMAILEKHAKLYYIVSDEDVLIMYKKAAELQRTCDAEICLRQIAEAIDADEVVYGNLYSKNGMLTLSLNNLQRDKKTLKMGSKSVVEESFPESQFDHFAREIASKAMDPSYKINKTPDFNMNIQITPVSFTKVEGVELSKINLKTDDSVIQKNLDFFQKKIQEADLLYGGGKYKEARLEYQSIVQKFLEKIPPTTQEKMKDVIPSLQKRIANSVSMEFKLRIEKIDREVEEISRMKE
jgi:hypothetical protein